MIKDGLNQNDRIERCAPARNLSVLDNRLETLLFQAEKIAGYIRYFDVDGKPNGHFDELLDQIRVIRNHQHAAMHNEGDMEASQALLYTFLVQLHHILAHFNSRWASFPDWVIEHFLGVESINPVVDSAWITFSKNTIREISIARNTGFTYDKASADTRIYYRLTEDISISNIRICNVVAVNLESLSGIYPENILGCPTGLCLDDLSDSVLENPADAIFGEKDEDRLPLGLRICSPALLLREGNRCVSLSFKPEKSSLNSLAVKRHIVRLIEEEQQNNQLTFRSAKELVLINLIYNIFDLEISTAGGWTKIKKYAVESIDSRLWIRFNLDESFPASVACLDQVHGFSSSYPALNIFLNHDSWLFAYVWLKDFLIQKIEITTRVEKASHLLFYNQLGEVDISKPFSPFGFNANQGAWFVIGNYEMAIKRTNTLNLDIKWQQLPKDEFGLKAYYAQYGGSIDNLSFRLKTRLLSDYKWIDTKNCDSVYLFSTAYKDQKGDPVPDVELEENCVFKNIRLDDTEPVRLTEENYHYDLRAKNGFVNFTLISPEIGFGEKEYHHLFTSSLLKKKKKIVNPPINPLIERISLTYESVEIIDLTRQSDTDRNQVSHIYPLGIKQIYPTRDCKPRPFVIQFDTDFNILFALENVTGNEFLNLYLELLPLKNEIDLTCPPRIVWYWGDGYYWQKLPDSTITRNTTQNLLTSGFIQLFVPEMDDDRLRDELGRVWIRMGVLKNASNMAGIKKIYTHVAKVVRDSDATLMRETDFVLNTGERKVPGIDKIIQITPFTNSGSTETADEKLIRVSEYISHRGRAVSCRDYERMALQAFPEISKIKCLAGYPEPGQLTLVVVPVCNSGDRCEKPRSSPALLLNIQNYFLNRSSAFVNQLNVINPVYEKIAVRCQLGINVTNHSVAASRAVITRLINAVIAPWQHKKLSPEFGYAFTVGHLKEKLLRMNQVREVYSLSVIHLIKKDDMFQVKEYTRSDEKVVASMPCAILIPADEHYLLSEEKDGLFGLNEMIMDENFVIWQKETERH